jgi:CRISPR-associated protein Cas1
MTEVAHVQISITREFKELTWQNIIKAKINNQAKVLEFFNNARYKDLEQFASQVKL